MPFRTCLLLCLGSALAACGGGGGGDSNPPPPPPAPTVTLTASAASVTSGSTVTLTWSATGSPTACTASGNWSGTKAASGTEASAALTANATFTLACTNSGGTGTRSVDVTVTAPPAGSGLDQRPSNASCVAPARPSGSATISVARVFPNLTFSEPVAFVQPRSSAARWYVVERRGVIRVFDNNPSVPTAQVFLDISSKVFRVSDSEAGLLGLAFHPNFAANGRVYVNYSAIGGAELRSTTSEFISPDGGLTLNPASERVLLSVTKREDNHNGGNLAFGPDGFLYVGLGDGGGGGDPEGNGQNPRRLLGKMLRIDVDSRPGGAPYGIPSGASGNPFAGNPLCNADGTGAQECPEIYAAGFRNPWRWSFDRQSGQFWVGDVGQGSFEEIDLVERGGNYGWDIREGAHCFNAASCQSAGLIDPVAEYDHTIGDSIIGGFVYRGSQSTSLVGQYLFADFGTGMIATLAQGGGGSLTVQPLVQPGTTPPGAPGQLMISSFGEGADGELYVLDYFRGHVYRLVFSAGGGGGGTIPQQLSATGCINTSAAGAPPLLSLIPYALNAPFWSDGAIKERWIGLPNGQNIGVQGDGDWDLPNGTVLVKHFRLNARLVETRLFMRHPDGIWAGYTYEWNAGQTDATRVTGGKTVQVAGQAWTFPSDSQCMQCHTQAAGFSLGLETPQQNGNHAYPQTGRTANQITTLNAVNVLSPPVAGNPPAYANPSNASLPLSERARAYLHSNCSNCHRPQGPTPVALDLRHSTPLAQTGACNVSPTAGDLGIANARIIAPGDAARSVLPARMSRRDAFAMPPIASNVGDAEGEQLLRNWINSLTAASCQ